MGVYVHRSNLSATMFVTVMPVNVADQTFTKHMDMALRTGETQVFEYALIESNDLRFVNMKARRMERMKFLQLCVIFTERKRMGRTLREFRKCAASSVGAPRTTVFIKDLQGRYLLMILRAQPFLVINQ